MINISSNTGTVNVTSTIGITKEQASKLKNPAFADRIEAWCKDFNVTHRLNEEKRSEDGLPESCLGMLVETPIVPSATEEHMQKLHEDFLAFVDSLNEKTDQGAEHGDDSKEMFQDLSDAVKKLCEEKGVDYMFIATHKEKEEVPVYISGNIPIPVAMILLFDMCYSKE